MITPQTIIPNQNALVKIMDWSNKQKIITKLLLTITFACLTGLFAQMRIYLPWTPIPITLQTLAVFVSGIMLGPIFGGLSQILYLLLGFYVIDWFANNTGGIETILGPTSGYLVGFVVASLITGIIREKLVKRERKTIVVFGILLVINFIVIYGLGVVQLSLWYLMIKGQSITFTQPRFT